MKLFIFYEMDGGGRIWGGGRVHAKKKCIQSGEEATAKKIWSVRGGGSPKIITLVCCSNRIYNSAQILPECLK